MYVNNNTKVQIILIFFLNLFLRKGSPYLNKYELTAATPNILHHASPSMPYWQLSSIEFSEKIIAGFRTESSIDRFTVVTY